MLQFSYYQEKTKSSRQYSGTIVNLADKSKKIGVLCSWFTLSSSPTTFSVTKLIHSFLLPHMYALFHIDVLKTLRVQKN